MRRSHVITLVCVAVIGAAMVVSVDYFHRNREFAKRTACIGTLIRLNLAKVVYAQDHGLTNGAVVPEGEIWSQEGGVHRCFSGGEYLINPVGVSPSCSYTGSVRWQGRHWTHQWSWAGYGLTNGSSQ
jgi:hypothetical protein